MMRSDSIICALCGEGNTPEGETKKGRFFCTCGKEWILEKRKSTRYSGLLDANSSEFKTSLILDSLSIFNSAFSLSELVDNFCEFVYNRMEERNISVLLMDMERSKIQLSAYKSKNPILPKTMKRIQLDYDLSHGVLVRSMAEVRSIYYHIDSEAHPFYKYYAKLTKTKAQLVIPIIYGSNALGLVTMDYPEIDNPNQLVEQEIMELLVGQFAIALRNSILYDRSKNQSSNFQNLHLSALTLSKLYLDKHDEVMRMMLLAASSFVPTSKNYLYEINHEEKTSNVFILLKDQDTGNISLTTRSELTEFESELVKQKEPYYKKNMIFLPFESQDGVQYSVHLIRTNEYFTRDDFEVLNAYIALSKITIDNTRLYRKMSDQKKFEREIEIAREIQINLLPKKTPQFPGYEFAGYMEAARGVGGDYYDFITSPDQSEVVICIGDVSGKGIGAGMVMATVRTILHSLVRKRPTPIEILHDINTYLYYNYKDSTTPRFMTMTIILWEPATGAFQFSGAGHGSILIYRKATTSLETIETKGIILGIEPDINSWNHTGTIYLEEGDSMLLFTDGVTESMNELGESFDDYRLIEAFQKYSHHSASKILDCISEDLMEFLGNREQHDDITMITISRSKL